MIPEHRHGDNCEWCNGYATAIRDLIGWLRQSDPDSPHPLDTAGRVFAYAIETGRWLTADVEAMKTETRQ